MNTYTVRRRLSRITGVTADSPQEAWSKTWPEDEDIRFVSLKHLPYIWTVYNAHAEIGTITLEAPKGSTQAWLNRSRPK